MNEEELKLLNKLEELPKELDIEIRGLILSEVCLRKENQQLKEQLEEEQKDYDRMFGLWHNNPLIKKFDDEYDEEDKKKNPNRDYIYLLPSAEEVYKRYYDLKERLEASEKARKESMRILGEYRHYTLPTEEQNRENEDIIDKVYNNLILKQDIDKGE